MSKKGAIVGALVGDAAGATLEFLGKLPSKLQVLNAMKMPGGGAINVAPGQFTDDGELTVTLANVLKTTIPTDPYPIERVALAYSDWYKSGPFDIGQTCGRAFGSTERVAERDASKLMMKKAKEYNMYSEANGALMRSTPIAVYYSNQPPLKIAEYARQDAMLSHPNEVCQDCNAIYTVAIAHLIQHPGDAQGAIEIAESIPACDKVKSWLQGGFEGGCDKNIGHVKHAFTLAFTHLRKKTSYEMAIYDTLLEGGDTDTNAAIVGGLIGALHGYESIPEYMRIPVEQFDSSTHDPSETLLGYWRPREYSFVQAF